MCSSEISQTIHRLTKRINQNRFWSSELLYFYWTISLARFIHIFTTLPLKSLVISLLVRLYILKSDHLILRQLLILQNWNQKMLKIYSKVVLSVKETTVQKRWKLLKEEDANGWSSRARATCQISRTSKYADRDYTFDIDIDVISIFLFKTLTYWFYACEQLNKETKGVLQQLG